jgi:hypothetical protein
MTNKTFSIAGYSKLSNGQYKARFANTTVKARTALLERGGQTDVVFVELPEKMTKISAAKYLLDTLVDVPPAAGVALKRALVNEVLDQVVVEVAAKATAKTSKTSKTRSAKGEVRAEIEA